MLLAEEIERLGKTLMNCLQVAQTRLDEAKKSDRIGWADRGLIWLLSQACQDVQDEYDSLSSWAKFGIPEPILINLLGHGYKNF